MPEERQYNPQEAGNEPKLTKKQRRDQRKRERMDHQQAEHSYAKKRKASTAIAVIIALLAVVGLIIFVSRPESVGNFDSSANPQLGPENASVVLSEYSDFQCPFCASAAPILKQITAAYPDNVKFIYNYFPLNISHPNAQKSAEAAVCADNQEKFWDYHDKLFEQQSSWQALSSGDAQDYFLKLASEIGVPDTAKFKQCVKDRDGKAIVNADVAEGNKLNISSTPTLFIDDERYVGRLTFDEIKAAVDTALIAKATAANENTNVTTDVSASSEETQNSTNVNINGNTAE